MEVIEVERMEEAKQQSAYIHHSGVCCALMDALGGRKLKRGKPTVSREPLVSIRSVVAVTLPPVLCKSHCIDRLSICGNIVAI